MNIGFLWLTIRFTTQIQVLCNNSYIPTFKIILENNLKYRLNNK